MPAYFRFLTIMAFHVFLKEKVRTPGYFFRDEIFINFHLNSDFLESTCDKNKKFLYSAYHLEVPICYERGKSMAVQSK